LNILSCFTNFSCSLQSNRAKPAAPCNQAGRAKTSKFHSIVLFFNLFFFFYFFIQYLGYRKRLVTVNIEQHQAGKDKCSLLCPFEKIVSGDRTLSPEKIAQILKEF